MGALPCGEYGTGAEPFNGGAVGINTIHFQTETLPCVEPEPALPATPCYNPRRVPCLEPRERLHLMLIILLIIVLLCSGVGFGGYQRGYYGGAHLGGGLGLIVLVVLVVVLLGGLW